MKCSNGVSILLLFLILSPSFAGTDGNTANYEQETAETLKDEMAGEVNPIAKGLGVVFGPLTSSMSAFFTKANEKIDYFITLINLVLIVNLLVVSQIIIFKIWRGLIKLVLLTYLAFKLLTAHSTEVPDLVEIISNGSAQFSEGLKARMKANKAKLAKVATLVKYMI